MNLKAPLEQSNNRNPEVKEPVNHSLKKSCKK